MVGELSKKNLKVLGSYRFGRFNFIRENMGPGKLRFKFENNLLKLSEIELLKNNGKFKGAFRYNIKTKDIDGNLSLKNMRLNDFNFYRFLRPGFDSDITAIINFKKNKNKFDIFGDLSLVNSSLKNAAFPSSQFHSINS